MADGNRFPSKFIYEMFGNPIGVGNSIYRLGNKHKVNDIGIGITWTNVGFLSKKPTDISQRRLYAITITFDGNMPQADGIAEKRDLFMKEAAKVFKNVGESVQNGKIKIDEETPYNEMFKLAYKKDKVAF